VRTLDDLLSAGVAGKRVLVRSDLNVPLMAGDTADSSVFGIADDGRIRASVPTIRELAEAGARVIVCSHLGRPKGAPDPKYSLAPVAARFPELLGRPVAFATDTVGTSAQATVAGLADGEVALLENLRFEPGETSNDPEFVTSLAGLAELYVGDAFGAVHRAHASVAGVPARLPHAAGRLVMAELDVLRQLTEDPNRPYVVVLGGSKVSDKLGVIQSLLPQVDRLLIGGGMCFTFLAAQGLDVGASLLEKDQIETCAALLDAAGDRIVLPSDIVIADKFSADAEYEIVAADAIPADMLGLDIGPESVRRFSSLLYGEQAAGTVFWNGPMGVFELAPFADGTRGVASAVAAASREYGAVTVVGGGDSAAAVRQLGLDEADFTHISTGGGASLEYLEGRKLPGIAALSD
jgi:phosphoglycerate kinase